MIKTFLDPKWLNMKALGPEETLICFPVVIYFAAESYINKTVSVADIK